MAQKLLAKGGTGGGARNGMMATMKNEEPKAGSIHGGSGQSFTESFDLNHTIDEHIVSIKCYYDEDFMKQNKAGSFYLCGCLGIEKSFSMEKEGLPWVEIMYVNCTSLTENIYILKGRKALLQLNEEKPIVLYEGCLLMIHGRVEEKHASGQCFEIRAR
ncbi:unnamed protein product [Brassica oleracea]